MTYPRFFCGVIPRLNGLEVSIPKISDSITLWHGLKPLWIRGNWRSQDITTLSERSTDLAVIGNCWASKETIKKEFRENAIGSKNFAVLMDLPGSYNLIVSDRDQTCIFTDTAGLRKVYYSVSESFVIYSSFSLVIQQLLKVDLNPYWLIANMIGDCMPELFQHISPFQDIQTVPPGYCLEISHDSINCKQYWNVPQADLGIIQAAENLRYQLIESIEIRANNFTNITSDLSGGLDSTGLALLTANKLSKQGRKLNTVTIESLSTANNEDDIRARHAVSLYPNIEACFFPVRDFPAYWSNLNESILTDEPFKEMSKIGQYKQRMNFLTSVGSQLHLTGDAADSIFLTSPSYLADIIRNGKYLQFIKHAYGSSRIWNISFFSLIKSATSLSSISYRSWVYRQARLVELRQKKTYVEESLGMGWSGGPSVASWYTDQSLDLLAMELYKYAETGSPFSNSPGQNFSISELHMMGHSCRILQQIGEGYGVNLDFPYLEPQIVNTCLNAAINERFSPFTYKPLLQAALKKELPSTVIKSWDSGDYTLDYLDGFKQNINDIIDLFDGSILHKMNIIDESEVKLHMARFNIGILHDLNKFNNTIGTEIWLRRLADTDNKIWMT